MLSLAALNRAREWTVASAETNRMSAALNCVGTRCLQLEGIQVCSVGLAREMMFDINQRSATTGNGLVLMTSPTVGCTDRGEFIRVSAFVIPDKQYR